MHEAQCDSPFSYYDISGFSNAKGFTFKSRNSDSLNSIVLCENSKNETEFAINLLLEALVNADKEVAFLKHCLKSDDIGEIENSATEFKRLKRDNELFSYSIKTSDTTFTFSFEHNKSENLDLIFKLELTLFLREAERKSLLSKYDDKAYEIRRMERARKNDIECLLFFLGSLFLIGLVYMPYFFSLK